LRSLLASFVGTGANFVEVEEEQDNGQLAEYVQELGFHSIQKCGEDTQSQPWLAAGEVYGNEHIWCLRNTAIERVVSFLQRGS